MSQGTILVVEDQPILRFIIERQLRSAGFDVVAEEGGEVALTTLETLTPDLILLNIQLPPGIDGIEVCGRIRANRRLAHLPVIFLSARTDSESRARCLSAGANDYVTKPWDASDLILRISNSIALARSQR
jgi:DNA-binding response OmpR family regulator